MVASQVLQDLSKGELFPFQRIVFVLDGSQFTVRDGPVVYGIKTVEHLTGDFRGRKHIGVPGAVMAYFCHNVMFNW